MVETLIALGSNLGDRRANLDEGLALLGRGPLEVSAVSRFRRTRPVEGVEGGWFLNAVLLARTDLGPEGLLSFLQGIEARLGRPAGHAPGRARRLDLDIIYYGDLVCERPGLLVPHPRRLERPFVIGPAAEVAPVFIDPVLGKALSCLAAGGATGGRGNNGS